MNCPDCDAQLYGDQKTCRCGWTSEKKKAANEDEVLPLYKRPCSYCGKPNVGTVNGKSACEIHWIDALYYVPLPSKESIK